MLTLGSLFLLRALSLLVDFDSFLKVLNRPGGFREPGEPEEYCRGFQVFDKDMTGFIGVGQLRYSKLGTPRDFLSLSLSFPLLFPSVERAVECEANHHLCVSCMIVLTNLGEKMSDEEVDELLKAVDTSSGEINYTDLVRTILAN